MIGHYRIEQKRLGLAWVRADRNAGLDYDRAIASI